MVILVRRRGISHFLQVVIMVALVTTLGLMLYSGSLDLLSGWSKSKQIILQSVYRIGSDAYLVIKNIGTSTANVSGVSLYSSGTLLGSNNTSILIEPGKAKEVKVTLNNSFNPDSTVDVIVKLDDGSVFKFRTVVE